MFILKDPVSDIAVLLFCPNRPDAIFFSVPLLDLDFFYFFFPLSKFIKIYFIFLKWRYEGNRTPDPGPIILKGTNGRQKTYEIFHVYCTFYSSFRCQTTVIFGITKDESLVLNTLASWNCFTCRNLFQNGANDMSECLTFETAFCKKAQNFV